MKGFRRNQSRGSKASTDVTTPEIASAQRLTSVSLHTVYQPVVNPLSATVFGYEALCRPQGTNGPISPETWFRDARQAGCSLQCDLMAASAGLQEDTVTPHSESNVCLFVNVLPPSLQDPTFQEELHKRVLSSGHSPEHVIVELVEYVTYNPASLKRAVGNLRSRGYRIALDDVGQGLSTLRAMVELEPDFLKLDHSLVRGISTSQSQQRLIHHLVSYIGSGDRVIAEGVENVEDALALYHSGVRLHQGYYWGRPLSFEERSHGDTVQELELRCREFLMQTHDMRISPTVEALGQRPREAQGQKEPRQPSDIPVRHKPTTPDPPTDVLHGTVGIIHGNIIVVDPIQEDSFATMIVPDDPRLEVSVDGQITVGTVVLSEKQEITLNLQNTPPHVEYDTLVSADKLSVRVKKEVRRGTAAQVRDVAMTRHLVLEVSEIEIYPETTPEIDILDRLERKGFQGRIDHEALHRLCTSQTSITETVLYGTPPIASHSNRLSIRKLETERTHEWASVEPVIVHAGTVLAAVQPEVQGLDGVDVFGQVIPRTEQVNSLVLGRGITTLNEHYIVAANEGRPRFSKHWIDVVSEHVVHGDVHGENLVFDGNIVVHGNVTHDADLRATGQITILGDVEYSTVCGELGVHVVGTVSHSNLRAGRNQASLSDASSLTTNIAERLEIFRNEYRTVVAHVIRRRDAAVLIPKIPTVLLEKRHTTLLPDLQRFVEYGRELSELSNHAAYDLVFAKWLDHDAVPITESEIVDTIHAMKDCADHLHSVQEYHAVLRISGSASSSSLRATGNILIMGPGSYSCSIESGHTVSVRSVVRGGFIVAGKSCYLGEFGTSSAVETSVQVTDPRGFVKAKMAHPNTLIQIGDQRHHFYVMERKVVVQGGSADVNSVVSG